MRPEISEGYMSEANKFRIWSKKYKMFTSDPRWPNNQRAHEEFVLTPAGEVWCLVTTDNENYFRDVSDKYVVQRATGLKDINNKEIYEGDIVTNRKRNWEIVWNEGGFFEIKEGEYLWEVCSKMQVIGNILENPKLA